MSETEKIINNNQNDCIICFEPNPTQRLCSECVFLYCNICSKKINYRCSICCRNNEKEYYYDEIYYYPNGSTAHYSCALSAFLFLGMILFYILVFSLFSFYHFINYNEVYHFIVLIRTKSIEQNLVNQGVSNINNLAHNIINTSNSNCYYDVLCNEMTCS